MPGTMEATVVWCAPSDLRGVHHYRIYQGDERNLIHETSNQNERQWKVKVPATAKDMIYVSTVSILGRESAKIPILISSNDNQYVVSTASDATPGQAAPTAPDWSYQPSGGALYKWY
jgi:hypothetical protein